MPQVRRLRHDPAQRRAGRQSGGDEQRVGSEFLGDLARCIAAGQNKTTQRHGAKRTVNNLTHALTEQASACMLGLVPGQTARYQGSDHGFDAWIVWTSRRVQHHAGSLLQATNCLVNKLVQAALPIAASHQRGGVNRNIDKACADGSVDLQRAQHRGTARNGQNLRHGLKRLMVDRWASGRFGQSLALAPPLGHGVLQPRRADHKQWTAVQTAQAVDQSPDFSQVPGRSAIKQDGIGGSGDHSGQLKVHGVAVASEEWQRIFCNFLGRLRRQVARQVALGHRRDGMRAHDGMAVQAMHLAVSSGAGKKVAKHTMPAQRGRTGNNREHAVAESLACQIHGPANTAYSRRAVKSGAHLVMHQRSR